MRALGAYIFAGGFTLGVKEHFDVAAVLEADNYGVETARRNQPETPIFVGKENWPLHTFKDPRFEFVYGNPPCAAWSQAGRKVGDNATLRDWKKDPRVDCARTHFGLLEELRPRCWAWESVSQAFTDGRQFVDELTVRALDMGYSVTYLLHNAQWLGVPQRRPRFFFVAHDFVFDVEEPEWTTQTLGDALRGLNDPGPTVKSRMDRYVESGLVAQTREGEPLWKAWERVNPEHTWQRHPNGNVKGRPPFSIKRPRADRPAPVVMHEMVHPKEHRPLTTKELQTLCSYPPSYEFVGSQDALHALIARGVCPKVGSWLARNVRRCIEREWTSREGPTVQLIDVRDPPMEQRFLPRPGSAAPSASLDALVRKAVEAFEAMPPEQQAAHREAQRRSWARAEAELSKVERDETTAIQPRPAAAGIDLGGKEPETVVAVTQGGRIANIRPKPGIGSGQFIRMLLLTGQYSAQDIIRLVHANYAGSKAGPSDVSWNKQRLKKEGHAVPPTPKQSTAGVRA